MNIKLRKTEEKVMGGLKDFQRATVERIFELYEDGQKRVLVADEVGLGKTLIAKGLIAKMARRDYEKTEKDHFKVVYICSNQNIANQNISKLKINEEVTVEGVTDTRLSMQHLKIFEQIKDPKSKDNYVQLTPLTPQTSFAMTSGCGVVHERALIFAILKRLDLFRTLMEELEVILIDKAKDSWSWQSEIYEERVVNCDKANDGFYLDTIKARTRESILETGLFREIKNLCLKIRGSRLEKPSGTNSVIHKLRMMFAEISVDLLKPDLVIMDEFQRFKSLLSQDRSSEAGILADKFLKGDETRVLLLSATPYKLYSTLEEINESQEDEHYLEFLQVVNFLFDDKNRQKEFKKIWSNFSEELKRINVDKRPMIEAKEKAENEMYKVMCRTERILAIETGDFIDDSSTKEPIVVTEKDVLSYIEAEELIQATTQKGSLPIDYVKSSPYLLSFMEQYKFKKDIVKYFEINPAEIQRSDKKNLWIDKDIIARYGNLDKNNARLEMLKKVIFEDKAEMLLWIPAAKPYYKSGGVFEDTKGFSKVLVFSAWEMVPRMISSLISYEAERKTVGKLVAMNKNRKNIEYFDSNNIRFPVGRLHFNFIKDRPNTMSMFCLLYPSKTLAELYDPIDSLNQGKTLSEIEEDLADKINAKIKKLNKYQTIRDSGREDDRWYFLAPLLLDDKEYVVEWMQNGAELISEGGDDGKGQKGFNIHLNKLKEYLDDQIDLELGKMPSDLVDVLVKTSIGSPAVCAYRSNGGNSLFASQLSKVMINMFNKQESTSVIELCYGLEGGNAYWKNVLSYCRDGNLQAVLDEYVHMLMESYSLSDNKNRYSFVHDLMMDAMQTYSASYTVDTYDSFKEKIKGEKERGIAFRTNFAVSFYKDEGDAQKGIDRKESIRNSFNSPFKPFVLATTSIGQEGLDFHFYCRKIMHWNLPSNPIDLEQREGRINRFKCHAIRQNIALKYEHMNFKKDIWNELFDFAKEEYNKGGHSELIPFWCLPEDQGIKIERIVSLYPLSKDIGRYERLIKILSLYRLTLGQARQEELLEHVFKINDETEDLKDLFINLSPFYK